MMMRHYVAQFDGRLLFFTGLLRWQAKCLLKMIGAGRPSCVGHIGVMFVCVL